MFLTADEHSLNKKNNRNFEKVLDNNEIFLWCITKPNLPSACLCLLICLCIDVLTVHGSELILFWTNAFPMLYTYAWKSKLCIVLSWSYFGPMHFPTSTIDVKALSQQWSRPEMQIVLGHSSWLIFHINHLHQTSDPLIKKTLF